jgi:hypothetical protein
MSLSFIPPCNLLGITPLQTSYGHPPRGAPSLSNSTLNPKEARQIMFGLVMVLALVLITVATPFVVIAKEKAKSRRR